MDNNLRPVPYLFSEYHLELLTASNTTTEQYISWNDKIPSERVILYQLGCCLLAPCTVRIAKSWILQTSIRIIVVALFSSFFALRRIYPSITRIPLFNTIFYMLGIGGKTPTLNRRGLLILILYGLAYTSLLNLLEAEHMAFSTVSRQVTCLRSIQEFYDTDLQVKFHPTLRSHLATVVDPQLLRRSVDERYSKLDLSTKRYAYMIGCDAGRELSQTAANYDPTLGMFMMALIDDPVASVRVPIHTEEFAPETGILEYVRGRTIAKVYEGSIQRGVSGSQMDPDNWLTISLILGSLYGSSIVVFVLEILLHRIQATRNNRKVMGVVHR